MYHRCQPVFPTNLNKLYFNRQTGLPLMKKVVSILLGVVLVLSGMAQKPKNILLICIDDLRPELASFGQGYVKSPHIDKLAAMGRPFFRHYVNAPSCGPSRCALLTGRYYMEYRKESNESLFARAKDLENGRHISPSMPGWFKSHGYTTVSVGKVSHHPGGRGGKGWNNDSLPEMPGDWDRHLMPSGPWQHPEGAMHGLANGRERTATDRKVLETVEGDDETYPDGLIAKEGLKQLGELARQEKPFFLAIGLIKPHLPFGVPKKYLDLYNGVNIPAVPHPRKPSGKTTWHSSGEFMGYDREGRDPNVDTAFAMELKRYYAACVSYADKHVGDIMARLKETGQDKNTIVVLWGDHGWHLGEHAIWGKHSLFEEALRSPLIIYEPGMRRAGVPTQSLVESLDIFPTLCDLAGIKVPTFTEGKSFRHIVQNPSAPGDVAIAFTSGATTLRTPRYRFTLHRTGEVELYDHTTPEKETVNIALQQPGVVAQLKAVMQEKGGANTVKF